jgi:hypothetical protein
LLRAGDIGDNAGISDFTSTDRVNTVELLYEKLIDGSHLLKSLVAGDLVVKDLSVQHYFPEPHYKVIVPLLERGCFFLEG